MWNFVEEPNDGWTQHERMLLRDVILSVYRFIEDANDRLVVVMCYECGYSQEEVASVLGVSQAAVSKRLGRTLKRIRSVRRSGKL